MPVFFEPLFDASGKKPACWHAGASHFSHGQKKRLEIKNAPLDEKVCDDNRATWAPLAGFKNAFDIFVQHVTAIGALSEVQRSARAGVSLGKQELTNLLVDEALIVAGTLCAYGKAKGDSQLCAFSDVARDDFMRLADADIDDKALGLHDKAKAILEAQTATPPAAGAPKVADFGLTADELTALKNRIAAYAEIVQSPRAATIKISTATEAIAARFAAADELLSMTLDKLAPRFKKIAPDFFSAYEGARVIVDAAGARKAPANGAPQRAEPVLAGAPA